VSLALDQPAIYIDPDSIIGIGYAIDTQFNITIKTNSTANDIWGYQFVLTYNPLVLEGLEVFNGDLINDTIHPTVWEPGDFDNNAGRLSLTGAYFYPPIDVTTGTGDDTFATVTFNVTGTGDTPITLELETILMRDDGTNIINARTMPYNIGHGYFRNTAAEPVHDGAVVAGESNVTSLYAGRPVLVNVTIKNNGSHREKFDVTIYYRFNSPDWYVYSGTTAVLDSGANETILHVWNTTDVKVGRGNLTVEVKKVFNETNTANNVFILNAPNITHIRIVGDINADGEVGGGDLTLLKGVIETYPAADPEADLNLDGNCDADDGLLLLYYWGEKETA